MGASSVDESSSDEQKSAFIIFAPSVPQSQSQYDLLNKTFTNDKQWIQYC